MSFDTNCLLIDCSFLQVCTTRHRQMALSNDRFFYKNSEKSIPVCQKWPPFCLFSNV